MYCIYCNVGSFWTNTKARRVKFKKPVDCEALLTITVVT